jgi:FemAB-related protein (PEP-CTERM system-associated)
MLREVRAVHRASGALAGPRGRRASHHPLPVTHDRSSGLGRIRVATDADAGRWNDFLNLCPRANFYQRYEWEQVNRESLGHRTLFLIAEHGGEVRGVLPLVNIKSALFGNVITSMPFVNFGGPAALDDDTESSLVAAACAHVEKVRARYLEIRGTRPLNDLPHATEKVSMTIELLPDPEAMMAAFSMKHRKNIRRAQKNLLTVRSGGMELLPHFYETLSESWKSLGTPLYKRSYFEEILRRFGDDVRIFVTYNEAVPVATALCGYFGDTVEGMWAGVDPAFMDLDPNYVLYWEMVADSCRRGYKYFHLGRSTKGSGAMAFKEKWLATPKQLYWNYHLGTDKQLPRLNPSNPEFALAIRTWRKLPRGLLKVIGPPIARLIP